MQRHLLFRIAAQYFPVQVHTPAEYDPSRQYVLSCHPHGIIGISLVLSVALDPLRIREKLGIDWQLGTVTPNFMLPLWRELLMAAGLIEVSRESIDYVLGQGRNVAIVVGGAREALDADGRMAEERLTLAKRKGFIRMALRHGADVIPVYSFGERSLFNQVVAGEDAWLRRFQMWTMRILRFSLPVFFGRGVWQYRFGLLPHRVPLHVVFGPAVRMPHIPEPTQADIDEAHKRYVIALAKLYYQWQPKVLQLWAEAQTQTSRALPSVPVPLQLDDEELDAEVQQACQADSLPKQAAATQAESNSPAPASEASRPARPSPRRRAVVED